jgi:3-phosphoshikimate 1-carboxyvinyltransferase
MRLLAGLLAGRPFHMTLTGDESLSGRPMARVIEPLAAMGAQITSNGGRAPLTIAGGGLRGIRWQPSIPSAQVKSALMLAGLSATGTTTVQETLPTRDHTERAFPAFGLAVRLDELGIHVPGGQEARAASGALTVPGDPSSAAVWRLRQRAAGVGSRDRPGPAQPAPAGFCSRAAVGGCGGHGVGDGRHGRRTCRIAARTS